MAGTSEGAPISIAAAIAPMDSSAVMFHVPCRDHRVRNLPLFQKQAIILLSGVPATGKSEFARHLARECGFAHYDLECHPRGWPHPELKATWTPAVQDLWRNCANITSASYLTGDSLPLLSLGSRNCGEAERNSSGLMATLPVHSRFLCSAAVSRWNVLTDKSRPSTKQDTRHHFSASSCPLCPPPEPSWLSARLKG